MAEHSERTHTAGKRAALAVGALALAGLAGAALWLWEFRPDSVMEFTVRLSAEDGRVSVHQASARFSRHRPGRPVVSLDLDLSQWKDELVRLDVEGESRARDGSGGPFGFLGC